MTDQIKALITECRRQEEACLYTSTSLFIWLRRARWHNRFLNGLQISVGAFAAVSALQAWPILASVVAILTGALPSIYEKLNLSAHIEEISAQAGQYKNLQDRFRQAAEIIALDPNSDALKAEFKTLMRQMEDLRANPVTAPEWCFTKAQEKIGTGHYDFDTKQAK